MKNKPQCEAYDQPSCIESVVTVLAGAVPDNLLLIRIAVKPGTVECINEVENEKYSHCQIKLHMVQCSRIILFSCRSSCCGFIDITLRLALDDTIYCSYI